MGRTAAFSYLRVSGRGQIEGDGFERQRDAIDRFAAANDLDIVYEFRDEGVSGTRELADRPGLAALLDRIETGDTRAVLVERADRLARDLMVSEVIVAQFARLGVKVVASDGTDFTNGDGDPTRTLIRQVLAAVSQFEKSLIVLKLRGARERKRRRTGACEGRKPFGARPGETAVLSRILFLRRGLDGGAGATIAAIAAQLNSERVATRTGRPWATGTVHGILARHKRLSDANRRVQP
jgi:DNA invertase Pin-like site-specific DNA recombinase